MASLKSNLICELQKVLIPQKLNLVQKLLAQWKACKWAAFHDVTTSSPLAILVIAADRYTGEYVLYCILVTKKSICKPDLKLLLEKGNSYNRIYLHPASGSKA